MFNSKGVSIIVVTFISWIIISLLLVCIFGPIDAQNLDIQTYEGTIFLICYVCAKEFSNKE